MSLKDKKSLFDRNHIGKLDGNVGTSIPGEGNFFTDKGLNVSPFDATPDGIGSPGGQMVDLLTKAVKSNNHPYLPQGSLTYNPSTKDLNGEAGQPSDFFDEGVLSGRKGQYKDNGPMDGRY